VSITTTALGDVGATYPSSLVSASITPVASNGAIYLFIAQYREYSAPVLPSVSGAGGTWVQLDDWQNTSGTSYFRITLFGSFTLGMTTGAITASVATGSPNSAEMAIIEEDGIDISSTVANTLAQIVHGTFSNSSSVTYGSFAGANNDALFGCFDMKNSNAAYLTASGSGWISLEYNQHANYSDLVEHRIGGPSVNPFSISDYGSTPLQTTAVEVKIAAATPKALNARGNGVAVDTAAAKVRWATGAAGAGLAVDNAALTVMHYVFMAALGAGVAADTAAMRNAQAVAATSHGVATGSCLLGEAEVLFATGHGVATATATPTLVHATFATTNVFIDAYTGAFYGNFGTAQPFGNMLFVQGDKVPMNIYLVRSTGTVPNPLAYYGVETWTLICSVMAGTGQPIGTPKPTPPIIASLTGIVPKDPGFTGVMDLSSPNVGTFLGTGYTKSSYFEAEFNDGAGHIRRYQYPCTVAANVNS